MQILTRLFITFLMIVAATVVWAGEIKQLRMSLDDVFLISENAQWSIEVEKELTLRFADIKIKSKSGYPFSMMLYFKCDTPDIAQFNTPERISKSLQISSEKYLPHIIEKKIELQTVPISYGFFTVLTDADLSKKSILQPGEFKYLTRGMVRLSKDSALGFSVMTNDINSEDYKILLDYVYSFVKMPAKS